VGLHQRIRAHLWSQTARHLAHRVEQRQHARLQLHGLVAQRSGTGRQQLLGERTIGRQMQIGEQHQALVQVVEFAADRLLHLEYQFTGRPGRLGGGGDSGASSAVLVV